MTRSGRATSGAVIACVAALALLATPAGTTRQGRLGPFIQVANSGDTWWFVDSAGQQFLSLGVNMIDPGIPREAWSAASPAYSALRAYPTLAQWKHHALDRLERWGFNTIGGWSHEDLYASGRLPFAVCLYLGASLGVPWIDLWAPGVERRLAEDARLQVARWRGDPQLIGYFYDNEIGWWDETLFRHFMAQPEGGWVDVDGQRRWAANGTRARLHDLFQQEYGRDLTRLGEDWVLPDGVRSIADLRQPVEMRRRPGRRPRVLDRFMEAVYERYEQLMTTAIRQADPNHLLLGARHPRFYSPRHVAIAGRWNDVISTNMAAWWPDGWVSPNWLLSLTRLSGRPVLVSEFYFAAMENASGNPNSKGPFPVVRTQADRAQAYAAQVRQMATFPGVVGWHWFQYYDEPPAGREDGEDFNMGLVDIDDGEYDDLVAAAAVANREAPRRHGAAHVQARTREGPPGFRVPPAVRPPLLDGDLRDWDKAASWLPETRGHPFDAALGDYFVSVTPGLLHVAVAYQAPYRDAGFVEPPPAGTAWPVTECEQVSVEIATHPGERVAAVVARQCPGEEWALVAATAPGDVVTSRTGALEMSIPIPEVAELRFRAEVRSRAGAQTISWGARSPAGSLDDSTWGRLVLPAL